MIQTYYYSGQLWSRENTNSFWLTRPDLDTSLEHQTVLGKGRVHLENLRFLMDWSINRGGVSRVPLTYGGPYLAFFGPFLSRFRAVLLLFTTQKICLEKNSFMD